MLQLKIQNHSILMFFFLIIMFHQLVISHEGLLCDEINKNIQKLKKESRPDTTKITKLHLNKKDTEEELEQAKQRLEKLETELENLKRVKKTERQAKADAISGNIESNKQQGQRSTKQQGEKRNEIKEKQAIKKAKIRIGINTKVLTPNK